MNGLRNVAAVVVGVAVACLLAYLGAVIVLLVFVGIPLGSSGSDPTPTEYAFLLAFAAIASVVGGRTGARVARASRTGVVVAVAGALAVLMLWGFTGKGVQWPRWWAPTLAMVMGIGASSANWRPPRR